MREKKDIDQMLGNIDQLLDIEESPSFDFEKVSKEYHDKKLREQKGNSRILIAAFFFGISLLLLSPNLENAINIVLLWITISISYWLNHKAKKEIESLNFALSFNEFKIQRKNIALASLKQFKGMRIVFYTVLLLALVVYIYSYLHEPSTLKLVTYTCSLSIGSFIMVRAIEGAVKEYRKMAEDQS